MILRINCVANLASKSTFGAVDQKEEGVFNKDYSILALRRQKLINVK